jgi:hypothetical protein
MQGYRPIIAINIVVLLILCVFVVRFVGFPGGAGQATARNVAPEVATADVATVKDATPKDATATATTGSAVAAPADDAVTVTAIAGSPDVILSFAGESVNATPFIPDYRPADDTGNLVEGQSGVDSNEVATARELYDATTSQLRALAMRPQGIYEVEQLYLDAQHRRLIYKAIEKRGEPADWGFFRLSSKFTTDMEQAKKLELTTGDGARRIFVLAGSSESSGQ